MKRKERDKGKRKNERKITNVTENKNICQHKNVLTCQRAHLQARRSARSDWVTYESCSEIDIVGNAVFCGRESSHFCWESAFRTVDDIASLLSRSGKTFESCSRTDFLEDVSLRCARRRTFPRCAHRCRHACTIEHSTSTVGRPTQQWQKEHGSYTENGVSQ